MKKTPQQIRRQTIKKLFDRVLKGNQIKLNPLEITVNESFKSDFTSVDMSISSTTQDSQIVSLTLSDHEAKGFVDGMFRACHKHYSGDYPSLNNIRLVSYQVKPRIDKSNKTMGTDAETEVAIIVDVKDHGVAEFSCTSRSILHSSFITTLKVFQFYVNCEKTFTKIKLILEDANHRNRADISQKCMTDLSMLTEVNTYA